MDQQMDIAEATGEEVIVDDDGDMQAPHVDDQGDAIYQGMDEDDQAIMIHYGAQQHENMGHHGQIHQIGGD